MKSIIPLSAIALVAALIGLAFAGCGQNPEGNLAGASSTNSNAAIAATNMPGTNAPTNVDTNMPASTNLPVSTNK